MILDGKVIAEEIQEDIKQYIRTINGRPPCLTVILVGENPASQVYVRKKIQACEQVGILSTKTQLSTNITQNALLEIIQQLNLDPSVDGILVQLPLPNGIDLSVIMLAIDPNKDVDGFHPINTGKMLMGQKDGFIPCTPLGIQTLLLKSNIEISGKHAVILGRSNIVGKPMAALLMQNGPGGNATVTVANSKTPNLKELCQMADILIAAIGQPKMIKADMVKPGAVVIDVGINRVESPSAPQGSKLVGDVDFELVKEKCSFITPVPGGVGPMTIAMLLNNTLKGYLKRENLPLEI